MKNHICMTIVFASAFPLFAGVATFGQDEGDQILDGLSRLEAIFIRNYCWDETDGWYISSLEELDHLDFCYRRDPEKLFGLIEKTPNIEGFGLNYCPNLTDEIFNTIPFEAIPKLQGISMTESQVSEECVEHLNQAKNLEDLHVGWRVPSERYGVSEPSLFSDKFLEELELPKLKEINIYANCTITDEGLLNLLKFPCLRDVCLGPQNITSEGAARFCRRYIAESERSLASRYVFTERSVIIQLLPKKHFEERREYYEDTSRLPWVIIE